MIYIVWFLNSLLALIIASLIRKLFVNKIIKRLAYATFLSFFITFWFLYPGSSDLAPVLPIYFLDIIESGRLVQMRLFRPFALVFFLILIFDFVIFLYKSRKK